MCLCSYKKEAVLIFFFCGLCSRVFSASMLGRLLPAAPGDGPDQCNGDVLGGLPLGIRGIPLGQRH